ncbi:GspH/FimT family pseudopilin [bacterium BD-1]|uniref:GspH/FimT family pseudopilin n=1 Tax=Arenimonas sp. TaxID=1872635 RepID=UPI001E494906|nr:GspH/FimT family pseudopilin [Ottowia caeni]
MGRFASNQARTAVGAGSPRPSGFTLLELVITVAVLAVALGIAIPSFQGITNRNRLTSVANEVVAAMQLARMEAIRRNQRVVMCPSTDGSTCSGANWLRMVVREADAAGEVIREFQFTGRGLAIKSSSNVDDNNQIAFTSSGFARVGGTTNASGGLSVCSSVLPAAENTRDVMVAVSRISVVTRNGTAACTAATD